MSIRGLAAGLLLWLAACAPPPAPPPTPEALRVAATDLAYPMLLDLAAAYAQAEPGVFIAPSVAPRSALLADLADGRAGLGLAATAPADLFATPLGYVSFAVVVHPANPLTRLSRAQTAAIFTGQVREWGQVGGAGGGILVISRAPPSDAGEAFEAAALAGAPPLASALVAPTWEAMRALVGENPAAIGYLPAPELDASVKPLAMETELRALVVVLAPAEPEGPLRDFLAWAQSEAGQAAVAQRHAPVR